MLKVCSKTQKMPRRRWKMKRRSNSLKIIRSKIKLPFRKSRLFSLLMGKLRIRRMVVCQECLKAKLIWIRKLWMMIVTMMMRLNSKISNDVWDEVAGLYSQIAISLKYSIGLICYWLSMNAYQFHCSLFLKCANYNKSNKQKA